MHFHVSSSFIYVSSSFAMHFILYMQFISLKYVCIYVRVCVCDRLLLLYTAFIMLTKHKHTRTCSVNMIAFVSRCVC